MKEMQELGLFYNRKRRTIMDSIRKRLSASADCHTNEPDMLAFRVTHSKLSKNDQIYFLNMIYHRYFEYAISQQAKHRAMSLHKADIYPKDYMSLSRPKRDEKMYKKYCKESYDFLAEKALKDYIKKVSYLVAKCDYNLKSNAATTKTLMHAAENYLDAKDVDEKEKAKLLKKAISTFKSTIQDNDLEIHEDRHEKNTVSNDEHGLEV